MAAPDIWITNIGGVEMKLEFWGAAETVTGSMHLVETNGYRLLLDCGLFQGRRQEARERNEQLPFDASSIDAVVLSHAHIDHSGNLPTLVKRGFQGCIYATSATRDLCSAMLRDSATIQESDAQFVNKRNAEKGLPPVTPLYTVEDAVQALHLFQSVDYDHPVDILRGVRLTYRDAGHILGSASVTLEVTENGRATRLAFTGDVGRKGAAILRDPQVLERADVLITESTYGGRRHGPMGQAREKLAQVVGQTVRRGGVLIIPAFAVGRTQDIVYHLHELFEAGEIPAVPVYVDSPLAINVTEVFRQHPECYDEETHQHMLHDHHADPFGFSRLIYVRAVEDSKKLNTLREPAVIISASGMCEAGRILHHLRNHVGDPRTTVLFVGYQAEYTLGRKLVDGDKVVRIFGEEQPVAAHIETIDGYSAHADEQELLEFIGAIPQRPRQVLVVHGEPDATRTFAAALREMGISSVVIPERGQQIEV
jgi:metallo-beta-lactamase family protein